MKFVSVSQRLGINVEQVTHIVCETADRHVAHFAGGQSIELNADECEALCNAISPCDAPISDDSSDVEDK